MSKTLIPTQEYIEIKGARENNLKNVSLQVPKRKITVFTGVSGSGKSSIVFDTIATEAQRQLYENFSMFVRSFLPRYPQPDADGIENLSMAVIVDQNRLGGGSHSTVGTITDIYTVLRLLYSRIGSPPLPGSHYFSFNDPLGMCPECNGLGRALTVKREEMLDMSKSLNEGAITVPFFVNWELQAYKASGYFDNDKKLEDYSEKELELLLWGKDRKFKMGEGEGAINISYFGVLEKITRSYIKRDLKTLSERTQKAVSPYLTEGECPLCKGKRLSQDALAVQLQGKGIAELGGLQVSELIEFLKLIDEPVAKPMLMSLIERLQHMVDIGLGYISLDRETDTLSGGESQRIKMVKHLTSSLVDVTYIFDEPSVGLHPRDVYRLNSLLQNLRDKGNTVIVVEHDPDVIQVADYVFDIGPNAGAAGGQIVYQGTYQGLLESGTLTGRYLKQSLPIKASFRQPTGHLAIKNAKVNNLKNVSLEIPTAVLTVVTGVAGSGKSSLIHQVFLKQHPDAIVIDQSAVGANRRSNPATYTGVMDEIRKLFAKTNQVDAGLFSFNSKGACENCQGAGVIYTDLAYLDGVKTPCELCGGKRFKADVLAYDYNGKSISDVLALSVKEALAFFSQKNIIKRIQAMSDVGLDYLTLGQPLSSLSGGECQRIKLASELHKAGSIYVLDEPTTGLHLSDITHLIEIINRLVDSGNTVIAIEHHLDIIRNADWIIDMGPEGGSLGGEVMFTGTPKELKACKKSLTARYI